SGRRERVHRVGALAALVQSAGHVDAQGSGIRLRALLPVGNEDVEADRVERFADGAIALSGRIERAEAGGVDGEQNGGWFGGVLPSRQRGADRRPPGRREPERGGGKAVGS